MSDSGRSDLGYADIRLAERNAIDDGQLAVNKRCQNPSYVKTDCPEISCPIGRVLPSHATRDRPTRSCHRPFVSVCDKRSYSPQKGSSSLEVGLQLRNAMREGTRENTEWAVKSIPLRRLLPRDISTRVITDDAYGVLVDSRVNASVVAFVDWSMRAFLPRRPIRWTGWESGFQITRVNSPCDGKSVAILPIRYHDLTRCNRLCSNLIHT